MAVLKYKNSEGEYVALPIYQTGTVQGDYVPKYTLPTLVETFIKNYILNVGSINTSREEVLSVINSVEEGVHEVTDYPENSDLLIFTKDLKLYREGSSMAIVGTIHMLYALFNILLILSYTDSDYAILDFGSLYYIMPDDNNKLTYAIKCGDLYLGLTNNGDGSKFLSDNGEYLPVTSSNTTLPENVETFLADVIQELGGNQELTYTSDELKVVFDSIQNGKYLIPTFNSVDLERLIYLSVIKSNTLLILFGEVNFSAYGLANINLTITNNNSQYTINNVSTGESVLEYSNGIEFYKFFLGNNKQLKIVNTGAGDKYLSDNGEYKQIVTVGKIDSNSDGTGEVFNNEYNIATGSYSHTENGGNGIGVLLNSNMVISTIESIDGNRIKVITSTDTSFLSSFKGSELTLKLNNSNKIFEVVLISRQFKSGLLYYTTLDITENSIFSINDLVTGSYSVYESNKNSINKTTGDYSHTEGISNITTSIGSHTEGMNNLNIGNYSHILGNFNKTKGLYSHAEGIYALALGDYTHVEGSIDTQSTKVYIDEIDTNNLTFNINPISVLTIGNYYLVSKNDVFSVTITSNTFVEGNKYKAKCSKIESLINSDLLNLINGYYLFTRQLTIASGLGSHAEGCNNTVSGNYSHAEGFNNKSTGMYSHTEGSYNTSTGMYSHTEGSYNTSSGVDSHTEGSYNTSSGVDSHTEGKTNIAEGNYSHAEGCSTRANNSCAHAEGYSTIADSLYSHSEGAFTKSLNRSSHSEGENTTASGNYSHTEGYYSLAEGIGSHAENKSISYGKYSHSEGGDDISFDSILISSVNSELNLIVCNRDLNAYINKYIKIGSIGIFLILNSTTGPDVTLTLNSVSGITTGLYNCLIYLSTASGISSHSENKSVAYGYCSHAEGIDTYALGLGSHTEGNGTTATMSYAHAEGFNTIAEAEASHAEGYLTLASGYYSHAEGLSTTASGMNSHSEGFHTMASEQYSHAEGDHTTASGDSAHAEGNETVASGIKSHAEGQLSKAIGVLSHAEGYLTLAIGNYAHAEGGGAVPVNSSFYTKSNDEIIAEWERLYSTPTIYENGDGFSMAKGKGSHSEGKNTLALGDYSHAGGEACITKGIGSRAFGYRAYASGSCSLAFGYADNNTAILAKGACSFAGGNTQDERGIYANGHSSFAFGFSGMGGSIEANGEASVAIGYNYGLNMKANGKGSVSLNVGTISDNFAQTSIGVNNIEDSNPSASSYNSEKTAFVIGNGPNISSRGDAFKVLFNGQTYADGAYSGSGADYAEMFEWKDGNLNNEDRVGRFVTLNGKYIEYANESSNYILGVVSGAPSVIGDDPMRWHGKYLNDEWGRPIYEDVEVKYKEKELQEDGTYIEVEKTRIDHVRKLNPEYNKEQEYIPRILRSEWDYIGMMGKILVKLDGTLIANSFCKPSKDGLATKSDTGYYVMEIISDLIARILFK